MGGIGMTSVDKDVFSFFFGGEAGGSELWCRKALRTSDTVSPFFLRFFGLLPSSLGTCFSSSPSISFPTDFSALLDGSLSFRVGALEPWTEASFFAFCRALNFSRLALRFSWETR